VLADRVKIVLNISFKIDVEILLTFRFGNGSLMVFMDKRFFFLMWL